ncbi:hypothetical protein SJAV_16520 [Sulfurisphaera javensis]|uniref:Uncharacterized protein n=1 Tax=Sulfurisphaera javensis TaxID=2049879 RepID=A0AAT9GS48_9CREN
MVKLKTRNVEELLVPPLPEYSYICNGEIRQTECKGSLIFRDPDYILITPQDVLQSFSFQSIINKKLRGRKLERWKNYIVKYNLEIENKDMRVLLENSALLTVYVDGISVCEINGEVVMKEYRVVGSTKNFDEELKSLKNLNPSLILINQRDPWYMLTAYRVLYITPELRKELSQLVGLSRIECDKIEYNETTICYIR